jgi:hypothetical protein
LQFISSLYLWELQVFQRFAIVRTVVNATMYPKHNNENKERKEKEFHIT